MTDNVFLEDDDGNKVSMNCIRYDTHTQRLLEKYQRASGTISGEKDAVIVDLFKTIRGFTFTCVLTGASALSTYYSNEQKLTRTMPQSAHINMTIKDSAGNTVYDGSDVTMESVTAFVDMSRGADLKIEYKVTVVFGAKTSLPF